MIPRSLSRFLSLPAVTGLCCLLLASVAAPWGMAANPVITETCEIISAPDIDPNTLPNGNTVEPTVSKDCATGTWTVTWPSPGSPSISPGAYVKRKYTDGVLTSETPGTISGSFSWELKAYGSGDTIGTAPYSLTFPAAGGKPDAYMKGVFKWTDPCGGQLQRTEIDGNTKTLESPTVSGCTTDTDPGEGGGLPGDTVVGAGQPGGGGIDGNVPGGGNWRGGGFWGGGSTECVPVIPDRGLSYCGWQGNQNFWYPDDASAALKTYGTVWKTPLPTVEKGPQPWGGFATFLIRSVYPGTSRLVSGTATVTVESGDPTTHEVQLLNLWQAQFLSPATQSWDNINHTISQPVGPYSLLNVCWEQYHGATLYLRCTRKKAGELVLRLRMTPDQPGSSSMQESLVYLQDAPEDLPSADSGSFTYTETGGNRYRKVSLKGRPMPDGKPQTKEESDVEDENAYVDALSLNLAYDTTDVFVPLVGDGSLSVRRQHVQELWTNRPGMSPVKGSLFSSLERPFGAGWRTGLTANVRFSTALTKQGSLTVNDGPTMVYVTDEQGATHRFVQAWTVDPADATKRIVSFIPLPSQTTDQDSFLTTLATVDTSGNPLSVSVAASAPNTSSSWKLKFTRKFGTTIFFEPAPLGSQSDPITNQVSAGNAITYFSGGNPTQIEAYFRVRSKANSTVNYGIEDASRNRLYYTYTGTTNGLVPSEISPDADSSRRLKIIPSTTITGGAGSYIDSIELYRSTTETTPFLKWKYLYNVKTLSTQVGAGTNEVVELLAVRGPGAPGSYGTVQKGYAYDFAQEKSELPPDPGSPTLYHYTHYLRALLDGGGNRHVIDYGADFSRRIKKSTGWYRAQGFPYQVRRIYFQPSPGGGSDPFNSTTGVPTATYMEPEPEISSSYFWTSSFSYHQDAHPYHIVRDSGGNMTIPDSESKTHVIRDASGIPLTWHFTKGKVYTSEPFKNLLFPDANSLKNPVVQVCWTQLDISHSDGLSESYEFEPAWGMALKKATDLSKAVTEWTCGDDFRARWFAPVLGNSVTVNGVSTVIDTLPFFPQRYSDPTEQKRIIKYRGIGRADGVELTKTFKYWSSGKTLAGDHTKPWSRSLIESIDENGNKTAFTLDTSLSSRPTGWTMTETVTPAGSGTAARITNYQYGAYGNLVPGFSGASPTAVSPAFIWKTEVIDGAGTGRPLVTHRWPDSFWRPQKELVGSDTANNDRQVTRFLYDALGRLTAKADGRAMLTTIIGDSVTTSFEYTPEGRLFKTIYPESEALYPPGTPGGLSGNTYTQTEYDPYSRRILWTRDLMGIKTWFTYSPEGMVISKYTDWNGDGLCTVGTTDPSLTEPAESWQYDKGGFLTKSVSTTGIITEYFYNLHGALRLQSTLDPADPTSKAVTEYTYNFGQNYSGGSAFDSSAIKPSRVEGPFQLSTDLKASTNFIYDSLGRKVRSTAVISSSLTATTDYFYDNNGNEIKIQDAGSQITETDYDALNRAWKVSRKDQSNPGADFPYVQTYYTPAGLPWKVETQVVCPGYTTEKRVTQIEYDLAGRKSLEFMADPAANAPSSAWSTKYDYNAGGGVSAITSRRSLPGVSPEVLDVTSLEYDFMGREKKRTLPAALDADTGASASGIIQTWFDRAGRKIQVRDPRGYDSYTFYDTAGRAVKTVSPIVTVQGQSGTWRLVTTTSHNVLGNPLTVVSGRILFGTYSHEAAPMSPYSGENTVKNTYNARGLLTQTTTYPSGGPVETDPAKQITTFAYDNVGNKTLVTDSLNNQTAFAYDALARVTETRFNHGASDAGGASIAEITRNTYNHAALTRTTQLMRGTLGTRIWDYTLDYLYQPKAVTYSATGSATASRTYNEIRKVNSAGELLSVACDADPAATPPNPGAPYRNAQYIYDRRGRLTGEVTIGDRQHSYEYDNVGNRTRAIVSYGNSVTVDSAYDALGRLITLTEGTRVTTYQYDKAGNLRKKLLPNQITEEKTFDALNRALVIRHFRAGLASALDDTAYSYTSQSSVAVISETYPAAAVDSGNLAPPRTITNTYDRIQRLLTETIAVSAGSTTETTYAYDKGGNRSTRTVRVNSGTPATDTYYHGYGQEDFDHNGTLEARGYAANQLRRVARANGDKVVYLYDDFGNRTVSREYLVGSGTGTETRYTWDQTNRLVKAERQSLIRTGTAGTGGTGVWGLTGSVSTWEFDYDHRGRQVIRNGPGTVDAEISFYSGGTSIHQTRVTEAYVPDWRTSPGAQTTSSLNTITYVRGSDMGGGVGGILYSLASGTPTYQQHSSRGDVTAYTNSTGKFTFQSLYESFGKHTDFGTAPTRLRPRASSKDEEPVLGLLNEGFRYRDTDTGAFLSRDPAGFVDGPNLYSYVRQNPWTTFDPDGLAERRKMSDDTYFVQNKKSGRYQMVVPELQNFGDRNRGWGKAWTVADYAVSPLMIEDPSKLSAKQIADMREALVEKFQADKELATAENNYATSKALASLIPGAAIGIAYADEGAGAAAKEAGKEAVLTALGAGIFKAGKGLAKLAKLKNAATEGAEMLAANGGGWKPTLFNQCFPAGTMILMADGTTKPIEAIVEGDEVLADDPDDTAPASSKRVSHLHRNWTERFIHVVIDSNSDGKADSTIRATGEHPFWTINRGWVSAKDLAKGDQLTTPEKQVPIVISVDSVPSVEDTYNFTVTGTHTYFAFAGKTPILVHNADPIVEFNVRPYSQFRAFPGDGLTGHEMLQNSWLKSNGYTGSTRMGANPSIALSADFHSNVVNSLQRDAGLHNPSFLRGQSAYDNIRMNISVLESAGVPRDVIAEQARAARNFAKSLPCP